MESSSTACASSEAVPHAESAKDPAAEPTDGEVHLAACWVSDALEGRPLETGAAAGWLLRPGWLGRSPWRRGGYVCVAWCENVQK